MATDGTRCGRPRSHGPCGGTVYDGSCDACGASEIRLERDQVHPESLAQMRERTRDGDRWGCWENVAMDSGSLGHQKFLVVGPTRTLAKPVMRMPDVGGEINWKYQWRGWVNLETGFVEPCFFPTE